MDNNIQSHIQKMDPETQELLLPFFDVPSSDEWVRDVLIAYFNYFQNIDELDPAAAKRDLQKALKPLVPTGNRLSLDRMEEFLHNEFQRKGYYFLGGMTGPYYGPYLWKRSEKRVFDVELPDRHVIVNVFFMYEFLIRSWMHYQTFGAHGTGGWVKRGEPPWEDGLYCVAESYDLERLDTDRVFQISMLKHEAQHFADKADYPGISNTDLEYRAKLVELIYFPEMKCRFEDVVREAQPVRKDPHRFASYRILLALSGILFNKRLVKDETLWAGLPYEKIQVEAAKLFKEHTRQLKNL